MRILLHICCAPCAVYPLSRLSAQALVATGYFYNPNIHPYEEHAKRLDAVRLLAGATGIPLLVPDRYEPEEHLARVSGRGGERCEQCYRMRLESAAAAARTEGCQLFTTTLLFSRRQKHDLIRGVAREMAQEQGIGFHDEDFRTGWQQGIAAAKAMHLYRQNYCGCVYSEQERRAEQRVRRR